MKNMVVYCLSVGEASTPGNLCRDLGINRSRRGLRDHVLASPCSELLKDSFIFTSTQAYRLPLMREEDVQCCP